MKSDLDRARAFYVRKKFSRVIRLLEPQVFQFRESFDFYYLLGMSCLRSGDSGGAKTYLDRALGLKPNEKRALSGLAVVHLKRYEVTQAIQCYLDIIDDDPHNRLAAKGLKLLRKNADRERLTPLIESGRTDSLLPREKSRTWILVLIVSIVALATVSGGYLAYRSRITKPPRESEVAALSLKDLSAISVQSSDAKLELSDREIEQAFSAAKRFFADFRDNMALREINRIHLSNATESVKEQARTIASFIKPPDFTSISDPFSFADVIKEPLLYQGTFVTWRGRTSNVSIGKETISLDLLVGYDTNEVLEGVVLVIFDFGIDIANGRPVEVLGEVVFTDNGIALRGISLHKLADG
jgi:hypothetical protein